MRRHRWRQKSSKRRLMPGRDGEDLEVAGGAEVGEDDKSGKKAAGMVRLRQRRQGGRGFKQRNR
jgi:hypothetical protein